MLYSIFIFVITFLKELRMSDTRAILNDQHNTYLLGWVTSFNEAIEVQECEAIEKDANMNVKYKDINSELVRENIEHKDKW